MTVSEKCPYQNMPFLPNEKLYILLWLHTKRNVPKACMDSLANTVWTMKVRKRLTDLQNVVWLINSDVMSWQHRINVSMKPIKSCLVKSTELGSKMNNFENKDKPFPCHVFISTWQCESFSSNRCTLHTIL